MMQDLEVDEEPHLLSSVEAGKEPDLTCLLLAYQASHLGGPIPGIKAAHLWARLPEDCIVCCYLHATPETS